VFNAVGGVRKFPYESEPREQDGAQAIPTGPLRDVIQRLQAGYQRVQGNSLAKLQFCEAAIAELDEIPGTEIYSAELHLECANILAETVRSGRVDVNRRGVRTPIGTLRY
jgi:hypothetical protein